MSRLLWTCTWGSNYVETYIVVVRLCMDTISDREDDATSRPTNRLGISKTCLEGKEHNKQSKVLTEIIGVIA